jgi:hypothetical protein
MVHPCRLTLVQPVRMVPLRGFSGDAKAGGILALRQPASKTLNGLARSPARQSQARKSTVYSALTQRRHTRPAEPMPTAHKTAHQLAIRAFVDWRWMRGRTRPDTPRSNQATTSLPCAHAQPLLPLDLKRGRRLGRRSAALSADINPDASYDAAGRQKGVFTASRSASTPRSNI